jgi:hypothetical protein
MKARTPGLALCALIAACASPDAPDASPPDVTVTDVSASDGSAPDVAVTDASVDDGSVTDATILYEDVPRLMALACKDAVQSPAPFDVWRADMVALFGESDVITFTFQYR